MLRRYLYLTLALLTFATALVYGATYRYDSYSPGRNFFSDGQQWTFLHRGADGSLSGRTYTATVAGDTAVSYYMDYYGEIVRVDQPCKIIRLNSSSSEKFEKRFAAYEWDAEIYVYSDLAQDFVQMLNFNKKEGAKFLYGGEKWQADRVDYTSPGPRLMKRYACSRMSDGRTSSWAYRAGADRLWLFDGKWDENGMLELSSYFDPQDGMEYTTGIFSVPSFIPDNAFYPEGREWTYQSKYYESRGENRLVTMRVGEEKEYFHVPCREVGYSLEDSDSDGETGLVCSDGQVMYAPGYMGLLSPQYDFRLQPGERALRDEPDSEVVARDVIEIDGRNLIRLVFKGKDKNSDWKYWVESIGGNSANDMLPYEEMDDPSEIYRRGSFVELRQGTDVLFEASDFGKEGSGICNFTEEQGSDAIRIVSLDGKLMKTPRPGSLILLPDGRKHLVL